MNAPTPVGTVVCELGEGPVWDPATRSLLSVDLPAGRVLRDGRTVALTRADVVTAVLPGRSGLLLVRRDRLETVDGEVVAHLDLGRAERCNDAATDPWGRVWIGTMHRTEPGTGRLFCVDRGTVRTVLEGLSISNGLGWSPAGDRMYLIDTPTRRVDVLPLDPVTHLPTGRRTYVDLSSCDGAPDGLAVDSAGRVWVASYGGGAVRGFDPAGRCVAELRLPVAIPTSVAFGGPALSTMYVTTSARPGPDGTTHPDAGLLHAAPASVPGLPTNLAE